MATDASQDGQMVEPLCYPVCKKCSEGCLLAQLRESRKTYPSSVPSEHTKKWKPDEIELACGEIAVMPVVMFGGKGHGKVFCEKHGKYERRKPRKKKTITYPENPLF